MHDPWTDKLSDHIDGLLSDGESARLRDHLEECGECRAIEQELRAVVAAAREAPAIEPARDLWAGIQAGIAGLETPAQREEFAQHDELAQRRIVKQGRRVSFSMAQLSAAAVVLMALTGTAVWVIRDASDAPLVASGTIVQNAAQSPRSTRTVAQPQEEPEFTADVADLEAALEQNRGQLDPATVEVIERSLESIDRAIADARTALEADPGNPYLHRQLDNTMRKKVDILRRATRVQRAGS